MDIETTLEKLEPIIRRIALRYSSTQIPPEDFAQELRLQAIRLYETYDPDRGGDRIGYLAFRLRFEAINLIRKEVGRHGSRLAIRSMKPFSRFEIDGKIPSTLEPVTPEDHTTDFEDVIDTMMCGSQDMQVLALRGQGMTLAEIGRRYGHSEAWACCRFKSSRMEGVRKEAQRLVGAV